MEHRSHPPPKPSPLLAPADDPRESLPAFARLVARLAQPFADRHAEREAVGLSIEQLTEIETHWIGQLLFNDEARAVFQRAYVEHAVSPSRAAAPSSNDERSPARARAITPMKSSEGAARALIEAASTGLIDSDETLPISGAGALVSPIPFQAGDYRPPPPLHRARERSRDSDDPDATRLPIAGHAETLPFAKATQTSLDGEPPTKPRKKS